MPAAYLIGQISVEDEANWAECRRQVPATLPPWGGEVVFRGRLAAVLAGEHGYGDTVVVRFPDLPRLRGWHDSPEYLALVPQRQQAAAVDLLAYGG